MSKERILIVDDEAMIRRVLSVYLTDCGYDTATAADGLEGLALARAETFQLVLLDLCMPGLDGLDMIAQLQAEQPALPLVMVSGAGGVNDAVEAMRRGAWDYITKPFDSLDEIERVVRRVLEKARLITERDHYQRRLEELNRSLEAEVSRQTRDVQARNRRLQALNRVSYAISSSLDLDTMLNRAIVTAAAAVEADAGFVYLLNPITACLTLAVVRGAAVACLWTALPISLGQGAVGQVAHTGYPCAGRAMADDLWLAHLASSGHLQAYLCVPLRAGDETGVSSPATSQGMTEWGGRLRLPMESGMDTRPLSALIRRPMIVGVLGIALKTVRDFDVQEVELLTAIGSQIGVAVENAQLYEQVRAARDRLQALSRQLVDVQESERRRIACELHDEIGQLLTGLKLLLEMGKRLPPEAVRANLDEAQALVNRLVQQVRELSLDLRPAMLDDLGLLSALLWHFERYTSQTGVQVAFKHAGLEGQRFAPEIETTAYRIVQEALTNVARHAGVNQVAVRLWHDKITLNVQVEDQGAGFDPQTALSAGASSGLSGMHERAALLGGHLWIESGSAHGTCLTAELPVQHVPGEEG